jgi:hypothetical protein
MCVEVYLNTFDKAVKIANVCTSYIDDFEIDALCDRYSIDAASVLGMESLVGNKIRLVLHGIKTSRSASKVEQLKKELTDIAKGEA